jgi:molybdopterin-containing oxidoreductase family iron-sulfur binding subunit
VEACPAGAIRFGDLNDAASAPAQDAKDANSFRILEKIGTEPKIYYRSKRDWVRRIANAPSPAERQTPPVGVGHVRPVPAVKGPSRG